MMKYWVISDTHFGHMNLTKKEMGGRPENFTERILRNIANSVKPEDVLIHLGDICLGDDEYWNRMFFSYSECKKWLVRGNHDKKSDTWYLSKGWDFVGDSITLEKFGKTILFSHMPVVDSGYDVNIHGHFHNTDYRMHEPELVRIKNDKQVLIAMETNGYTPMNLQKIIEGYDKRTLSEGK